MLKRLLAANQTQVAVLMFLSSLVAVWLWRTGNAQGSTLLELVAMLLCALSGCLLAKTETRRLDALHLTGTASGFQPAWAVRNARRSVAVSTLWVAGCFLLPVVATGHFRLVLPFLIAYILSHRSLP